MEASFRRSCGRWPAARCRHHHSGVTWARGADTRQWCPPLVRSQRRPRRPGLRPILLHRLRRTEHFLKYDGPAQCRSAVTQQLAANGFRVCRERPREWIESILFRRRALRGVRPVSCVGLVDPMRGKRSSRPPGGGDGRTGGSSRRCVTLTLSRPSVTTSLQLGPALLILGPIAPAAFLPTSLRPGIRLRLLHSLALDFELLGHARELFQQPSGQHRARRRFLSAHAPRSRRGRTAAPCRNIVVRRLVVVGRVVVVRREVRRRGLGPLELPFTRPSIAGGDVLDAPPTLLRLTAACDRLDDRKEDDHREEDEFFHGSAGYSPSVSFGVSSGPAMAERMLVSASILRYFTKSITPRLPDRNASARASGT